MKSKKALIAIIIGLIIISGTVFLYLKWRQANVYIPPKMNIEYNGQTLTASTKIPASMFRGTVKSINLEKKEIVVEADIKEIFPDSPIPSKNITVNAKNATMTIYKDKNREKAALTDVTPGDKVLIMVDYDQTNRDILKRDSYNAQAISITLPSNKQ